MEWFHFWSREYGVQYCEVIILAYWKGDSELAHTECQLFYPENKNVAFHISKGDWESMRKRIRQAIESGRIDGEIRKFIAHGADYLSLTERLAKTNLFSADNHSLLQLYLAHMDKWIDYTSHLAAMFNVAEIVSESVDRLLRTKMDLSKQEFEKLAYFTSKPERKVGVLELNEEFEKLKKNFSERRLYELHKEYCWLGCLDVHWEPMSFEEFVKYFNDFVPPLQIETDGAEKLLSEEELELVRLNQRLAYVKDLRDYYRRKGMFHAQKLFAEIGRRIGLTLKQVSFITSSEVIDFLKNGRKPDFNTIEKRINAFLMYRDGEKIVCVADDIENHAAAVGFMVRPHEHDLIKGHVASRGKLTGIAKVVRSREEIGKVSNGDILVAISTDANYTPAMAKAAAFVTDQGGILCHAAIVAREMKKPCIVGTWNATKLLKDGDLIELDDETGIVRKIS